MVQQTTRWTGEKVFKILDKDMGQLSYSGYTTYEVAKDICAKKNKLEEEQNEN